MDQTQLFDGFDDEQEKQYAREAVKKWGDEAALSIQLWHTYGRQKQEAIREEGSAIYRDLTELIGQDPESSAVQHAIARWHQHLRYFYEPTTERLLGLADTYVESPDFRKTFDQFDPQLAPFLRRAIRHYCALLDENHY